MLLFFDVSCSLQCTSFLNLNNKLDELPMPVSCYFLCYVFSGEGEDEKRALEGFVEDLDDEDFEEELTNFERR